MASWSKALTLRGPGIIFGHGTPGPSNPATANAAFGAGFLDVDTYRLWGPFDGTAWPTTYGVLRGTSFGFSDHVPTASEGFVGDVVAVLPEAGQIYGPKQDDGSWPKQDFKLQGAGGGTASAVAGDITGNSLELAPVDGDGTAVHFALKNAGGATAFSVDADGNTMVAGTLATTGTLTANTLNAGSLQAADLVATGDAAVAGNLVVDHIASMTRAIAEVLEVNGDASLLGNTKISSATVGGLTAKAATTDKLFVNEKAQVAELDVQTLAVGSGKAAGTAYVVGPLTVTQAASLGSLHVDKDIDAANITATGHAVVGDLLASGPVTAQSIAVKAGGPSSAAPVSVSSADGQTVFSVDWAGNVVLAGTLTVAGAETNSALNAGALTATSFINSGKTELQDALSVAGATSLKDLTAQAVTANNGLLVHQGAHLESLLAADTHLSTLLVDGTAEFDGTLLAKGQATLAGVSAQAVDATSVHAKSSQIDGTLVVSGPANLQGVSATDVSAKTLATTAGATVGTNLSVGGQVQIASGSQTPFVVQGPNNATLASLDASGDLIIAGALTVQGSAAAGANNLGALSCSSFVDSGNGQIQGTLSVGGATTLAALTAGATTVSSLTNTGTSQVASDASIGGNLSVAGNATIGNIGTYGAALHSASITRDKNGNAGTLNVEGDSHLGRLYPSETYTGPLQASGPATLQSTLATTGAANFASTVGIAGVLTAGQVQAGATQLASLAVTGTSSHQGDATFAGKVTSGGLVRAPAVTVQLPSSGASATPVSVLDANGNSLFSLDGSGDLAIAGTLSVAGAQTNTTTNAGALQATSFINSGNSTLKGDVAIQGHTTAADVAASSLNVSGQATLGTTTAGALTASSLTSNNNTSVGADLSVSGKTTLGQTAAGALTAASGNITNALSVGSTLTVSGASNLQALTAGATTAASLGVGANATVGGTLGVTGASTFGNTVGVTGAVTMASTLQVSGLTSAPAVAIKLPSNNASSTPLTVTAANNSSLFSLDSSGNLTVPGTISASNAGGSGTTTGALSATSISDSGTLSVQGNTTLAALSASSSAISGNETVGGTLRVTGATTLAALSAASLTTTGNVSVGGTFGATGASTLAAVSATNVSASGTLSVSGSSTLAGVSAGAITCTSVSTSGGASVAGALNAAAVAITLPSSGAASQPLLLKSNGGTTLLAADTSGNVTAANISGANLTASGTLAVTGATTAAAITSSATVQAKNLTLTSGGGGVLTFADGTTQSTASSGSSNAPATVWLFGAGPPNSSTAPNVAIGNFYADTTNNIAYGPSTSNSYTGLTNYFNLVGPAGPPGPSTAYRHSLRSGWWSGSSSGPTANTAYSLLTTVFTNGSAGYGVPVVEPMYAAGSLTAISANSIAGTGAGVLTFNVLKNGTVMYTADKFLTIGTNAANAVKTLPTSGLTFSANDVITMTVSSSTANSSQSCNFTLHYTTNS